MDLNKVRYDLALLYAKSKFDRIDYLSLNQGKVKMSKEQWALRSKDFIMEGIF